MLRGISHGSLPFPQIHHIQIPFLTGTEVVGQLFFFSKVRIGLGKESTTFHHEGACYGCPEKDCTKSLGYWFQSLKQPRSPGHRHICGLKSATPPLFTPMETRQPRAGPLR